jgi:hypothetical protein
MYHLLKQGVNRAWISFPAVCPVEQVRPQHMLQYADADQVFESAALPWNFPNEQDHPMHSCWLSLFDECAESLAYVVTETVFYGRRHHLTEKTFKPIALGMPFVLASTAGSLEYLRSYGFQTFGSVIDESYDTVTEPTDRLAAIVELMHTIATHHNKNQLYANLQSIARYNQERFFSSDFYNTIVDEYCANLNSGLEKLSETARGTNFKKLIRVYKSVDRIAAFTGHTRSDLVAVWNWLKSSS